MNKLIAQTPDLQPREFALPPGRHCVGRVEGNDLIIYHPSVSSRHAEIVVEGGAVRVKDLQSTNGTFVDGGQVQEAVLQPGQKLRFGSVEYLFGDESTAASEPPKARLIINRTHAPEPAAAVSAREAAQSPAGESFQVPLGESDTPCHHHPNVAGRWVCRRCQNLFCDGCISTRQSGKKTFRYCPLCRGVCDDATDFLMARQRADRSFFKALPEVFGYPLRKGGAIFLFSGAVFFAILDFMAFFAWPATIFATGYLFAFMQRIIVTSGQGDETLPAWPDMSDWYQDILQPFFMLLWTFFVCFGPLIFYMLYRDRSVDINPFILFTTLAFAVVYFPMALVAVCMLDNYAAVNPFVVLPAIMTVPLEYFVACIFFFVVVATRYLTTQIVHWIPIPFLPTFIVGFFALYFLAVEMRILGMLYFTNRRRIGWFER